MLWDSLTKKLENLQMRVWNLQMEILKRLAIKGKNYLNNKSSKCYSINQRHCKSVRISNQIQVSLQN